MGAAEHLSVLYHHLGVRNQPYRSRFNNFMNVARWDPEAALRKKAYELLAALKPRKGDVVELIIDDSKKAKRGRTMDAVNWIHDPVSGRSILGHQHVQATIRFRGHTIPFGVRLYVKREDCGGLQVPFKKTTQLAAEPIGEFDVLEGVRVRVLFDSYYLCPVVVKACRKQGFRFVSTLKSNRNLFKNGRKLKAGRYGPRLFRRRKKTLKIRKSKGPVHYTYVDAGRIDVSDLGRLHVVFSWKKGERKSLGLATDDPTLSAGQMIIVYNDRWSIEVFFKDSKQLLGLGQYQNGSYDAAVTHLHLVCFAYALLTRLAIQCKGAQGKRKRKPAARRSTGDLQNELRRIVWDDLADHLKQLPSGNQVIKELGRLLVAA